MKAMSLEKLWLLLVHRNNKKIKNAVPDENVTGTAFFILFFHLY